MWSITLHSTLYTCIACWLLYHAHIYQKEGGGINQRWDGKNEIIAKNNNSNFHRTGRNAYEYCFKFAEHWNRLLKLSFYKCVITVLITQLIFALSIIVVSSGSNLVKAMVESIRVRRDTMINFCMESQHFPDLFFIINYYPSG